MLKAGVLSDAQPRPDVAAGTAKTTRWKKRGVSILLHVGAYCSIKKRAAFGYFPEPFVH